METARYSCKFVGLILFTQSESESFSFSANFIIASRANSGPPVINIVLRLYEKALDTEETIYWRWRSSAMAGVARSSDDTAPSL